MITTYFFSGLISHANCYFGNNLLTIERRFKREK